MTATQASEAHASNRAARIREAFWLEWATVMWMVIEAAVAIAAGVIAGSISLLAFGIDSVIELVSAGRVDVASHGRGSVWASILRECRASRHSHRRRLANLTCGLCHHQCGVEFMDAERTGIFRFRSWCDRRRYPHHVGA